MLILAIDTTGIAASAALVDESRVIAQTYTDCKKNHSETILGMAAEVLERTGTELADVDYIACCNGPGSFTGLRIGAATAKGLAFGANKQIIPVPTLDVMAYNIIDIGFFNGFSGNQDTIIAPRDTIIVPRDTIIVPLMDARRNQAYSAFYKLSGGEISRVSDYLCEDIGVLLKLAENEMSGNIVFLGGNKEMEQYVKEAGFYFFSSHSPAISAAAVGRLALSLTDGAAGDFKLAYVRKPQAERERDLR